MYSASLSQDLMIWRNIETMITLKLIIHGQKKWFLTSVPLSNPVIKTHLFSITSRDLAEEDFELWTEEERGQSPEQIAYRCVRSVTAGVCWSLQKQLTIALHVLFCVSSLMFPRSH